jgi:hypothetical protein
VIDDCEVVPYRAWHEIPTLRPLIFELQRRVEGIRSGRVIISRLAPGKSIPEHVDQGAPATYYMRYHLALQSEPGAMNYSGDEAVCYRMGELWWFDNSPAFDRQQFEPMTASSSSWMCAHADRNQNPPDRSAEDFAPFLEEVKPLLPLHYAELALNKDRVPLSPQYDEYLRRDALGMVMAVTVRDAGELVGYFVGFIAPGLHYSTCLTLHLDIFWIRPGPSRPEGRSPAVQGGGEGSQAQGHPAAVRRLENASRRIVPVRKARLHQGRDDLFRHAGGPCRWSR